MFRTPARRGLPLAFIPPCIPTWARHAPVGRDWVHEIKHDGYRLMVRRQGARVRLFTRRGFDWSHRFPLIVEAAGSLRVSSISIDGEAVVCGDDGISDFDRLHSQCWDAAVFLFAFDVLEIDGDDLRQEPLERRKARLEKVLARAPAGIQLMSTSISTAPPSSNTPASSASKASFRSGGISPTAQAGRRDGSR